MLRRGTVICLVIFQVTVFAQPESRNGTAELGPKSVDKAVMLSLLHTIGGMSMSAVLARNSEGRNADLVRFVPFMYGVVIGPGAGNLYAEDTRRAYRGILIRTGGIILATTAAASGLGGGSSEFLGTNVQTMFFIGALTTVGSMVHSIFSSRHSVEEYNERLMEPGWQFGIVPEGDAFRFQLALSF